MDGGPTEEAGDDEYLQLEEQIRLRDERITQLQADREAFRSNFETLKVATPPLGAAVFRLRRCLQNWPRACSLSLAARRPFDAPRPPPTC